MVASISNGPESIGPNDSYNHTQKENYGLASEEKYSMTLNLINCKASKYLGYITFIFALSGYKTEGTQQSVLM